MNKDRESMAEKKSTWGWKAAGILFLAGSIVCTAVACGEKENQSRAEEEYDKLAELTTGENAASGPAEQPTEEPEPAVTEEPAEKDAATVLQEMGVPVPEKTVDFGDLQENTSGDIYAWIDRKSVV